MKLLLCLTLILPLAACGQVKPVQTEHGWKTDRVIATRYHNETMGWFVGFDFPKNLYDSDRAEVFEFIEAHGGDAFEGGGSPGAVTYVTFDGANSVTTLNKAILAILPGLSNLLRDISDGKPIKVAKVKRRILDKHGKEWPECVPPDPKDPLGEFNNNMNDNGTPYKCSGDGRWVVDQKAIELERTYEDKRSQLLSDLPTRKLTHDELLRVNSDLNTVQMQPFFPCEKYSELYDLLVKQWELQTGQKMPLYVPLSKALGEYNRCPQEEDNRQAVENLIKVLQAMSTNH